MKRFVIILLFKILALIPYTGYGLLFGFLSYLAGDSVVTSIIIGVCCFFGGIWLDWGDHKDYWAQKALQYPFKK